ncbi:AraC-like ligand-binding domain-containing protein [Streptomyces achromogenes]|uniref:AraC-like ligand-binding domain-containing protein n=1 Tax=Streptomyces achromogenes TaxID=67255 RepID=UPI0036B8DA88
MIGLTFRSEDMPAEDRFDHWRALLDRSRASEVASVYARDYRAECRLMELGPVTVLPTACAPARYRRGTRTVRGTDPERYHLTLLLDGDATLEHAGRSGALRPGDLHVVDSSRPYDLRMADDGGRLVRGIGVDFPKALLPLPPHRMGELLGRGLPVQDGVGALLTQMLAGLERQADTLRPADAPRLGAVVLDLLSAWLAQLAEAEAALAPETRHRVMAERVLEFIKQNLHDPELSPPVIAAAHHISLSYLHRVFRQWSQGESVAAWIRRRRLEGARRDLADPLLRGTPIHTIAARWGLPRASDFTRAFRAAYGVCPKEFRCQALPEPVRARVANKV